MIEFATSGSSGAPKIIRKPRALLAADAAMLAAHFGAAWFEPVGETLVLATISRAHMYGRLWLEFLMEALGGVQVQSVQSPEELLEAQQTAGGKRLVLITTPSFLSELVEHPLHGALRPTFRAVVTSGSLLLPALSRRAEEVFGVSPTEIYGSTETGSVAWRRQAEGEAWTLFEGVSAQAVEAGVEVCSPYTLDGRWTLQDGVVFLPDAPRRFRLLGRQDRRVKVLEQWVSLPAVEAALEVHPWLAQAAAVPSPGAVARIWAVAMLSPAGREAVVRLGYAGAIRQLRRELAAAGGLSELAMPRRFRFVPALPYNARGKLPVGVLQAVGAQAWQQPIFERLTKHPEGVEAEVIFPEDHAFFAGHFPGFAVLPGVAQLVFVRGLIGSVFGVWVDGPVAQLKFQQVVRPLQRLRVQVERTGEGSFSFTIERGEARCSAGRLSVGMASPAEREAQP